LNNKILLLGKEEYPAKGGGRWLIMSKLFRKNSQKASRILEALLALTGICIFALFIHSESLFIVIAFLGLVLTALNISKTITDRSSFLSVFGIIPFCKKTIIYSFVGIFAGGILGLYYRQAFDHPLLPTTLTIFAVVAPLIGITEELVFRGFIQGRLRVSGSYLSVILAACGHTLYKYLVLKTMPSLQIDFQFLVLWTLIGGLIFGTLREISKSVIPSSLAHACFDVIVYGGFSTAPIWVWS
jgi:membrane protease YdiL (CAAX protease family)